MELRVLQYFLAIAREQSISGAAEFLHISQPTLSRQIRDMEEELGKQLFIRGNRRISLTEEGMILRKRAEEILGLVKKTEDEIAFSDDISEGDVYIGAGETHAVHLLAEGASQLQLQYPGIRYHIASGDTTDVLEELDRGLIDFGLLFDSVDKSKYECLQLPHQDIYGILMRRDCALAKKEVITPEDLWELPLICNRNSTHNENDLFKWLKKDRTEINIIATYNLLYNASIMVEAGIGYAFALDNIINTTGTSPLCFRPLSPRLDAHMFLVWKKYQVFSKAAEKYLLQMQELMNSSY
ncbi:LysR family transcriptional regulator [Erysipelotrichaceae bacterium AF15-26LB]|nr:transcriptional regulator, LysR family [Erysipelotrichaceae bacterium 3_1_53]MCR0348529.1 LysR family transcriptional regulator [[Clostridium] innocuum]RJV88423.1 LysR family transcriptional regulator [Erysipelotrichaceae bacterium AF19-24AC]RJV90261.1 LysR family transcriptional regulator [Erysipelotrichaceae bacterium AF15-26LB]